MIDPEAISEARRALGRQLADFRDAAGLIQDQLAPLVQYGRSTVANAETGHSTCSRTFWERADKVLHANGALLRGYNELKAIVRQQQAEVARLMDARRSTKYRELQDQQCATGTDASAEQLHTAWSTSASPDTVDGVKRRTTLVLPALTLVAAVSGPSEPWKRLAHALEHPGQLDETTLEALEAYTAELFRREEHLPARQLASHLDGHTARLEHLLTGAPDVLRRRLLTTTGEALALAGWVAWDSEDPDSAHNLYERASDAARQAGDGPLHACVLAYRSYEAEADGDLSGARQLLTEAQGYVRSEHSATTRAWLAAREAEVDAALNDDVPALRALDRAMTAYDYAHPHRERSWTEFFTPSRLGSMTVTTYARLDHNDLDATADSVVASLPSTDAKIKAVILADVASATIQRGRHKRGAELGHHALDQTLSREASLGRQRLRDLHLMIQDKRDVAALAELDERLLAHVA